MAGASSQRGARRSPAGTAVAAAAMASKPVHARTASSLHADGSHTRKLSTGCAVLDGPLGGGLDSHGITELAGEAGVGKTQLALQLVLQSQLPPSLGGLGGGAVLLHADSPSAASSLARLRELAGAFAAKHARLGATQEKLLENVFVLQIESVEHLWTTLGARVEELLMNKRVRLLVLDSVAGLFRTRDDTRDGERPEAAAAARAQELFQHAARLKLLSDRYDLAVLVLNQVSDKPLGAAQARHAAPWELAASIGGGDGIRVPALGLSWGCAVNTRLLLARTYVARQGEQWAPDDESGGVARRELRVAYSPRLPHDGACAFEVRADGVFGCA